MSEKIQPVRGHVTIEKHGKSLKLQQLISVCLLLVGIGLVFANVSEGGNSRTAAGAMTSVAGMLWLAVTKVRMWWHHG